MITFLVAMAITGLAIIGGLLWYQKKNIHTHSDAQGNLIPKNENPLSLENIHTSRERIHNFAKEEAKYLLIGLLRLLIKLKRVSRKILDKSILKLANIAFPEEKLNGPIDENNLLLHVEDHKKHSSTGRIE